MDISIVIPVYNREESLQKTLESIKKQTYKNYEIIIVDDHSEDNSAKIAKKYTEKVIVNKKRLGVSKSRNTGIKNSSTEHIVFIDSDCIAENNWLEKLYKEYKKSNELIITSGVKIPKSTFLGDCISELGFPAGGNAGFINMWKVDQNSFTTKIATCNCLIHKSVFNKLGYFEENFPYGAEDTEFSFRAIKNGIKIKYTKDSTVWHEARKDLLSFINWQIDRGKGNYYLKQKIGNVDSLIKLRFWSTKNIFKKNLFNKKILPIVLLQIFSFILQQYGYLLIKLQNKTNHP